MAADNHHNDASGMDYAEHDKTFDLFAGLIKWGTVGSLMITLLAGAATHAISWIFAIIVSVLMSVIVIKFF